MVSVPEYAASLQSTPLAPGGNGMLTIKGAAQQLCEGTTRRDFPRLGAVGTLGLSLPDFLRATASRDSGPGQFGRAKRCVLLFLTGGAPQLDTFDPKPDTKAEYRGEFKPIATNVPGVQLGE